MTLKPVLSKLNVHSRDENINFYEEDHRYEILSEQNTQYTSVTTWIHTHFSDFDSSKIIKNMMKGKKWKEGHKYWGLSEEEIKSKWKENGRIESQAGTDLHFQIECFMNNDFLPDNYNHQDLLNHYNQTSIDSNNEKVEWTYFINYIKDTPHFKPFRTEWVVFHDDLKLAGSIDMVYENEDGTLNIYDWKRSKEITKVNNWNNYSTNQLICEMPDANYWHYALQLNTYKLILEQKYNKTVKDLYLVRLHPNAEENNYELIKVHDLSEEVTKLFNERMSKVKVNT